MKKTLFVFALIWAFGNTLSLFAQINQTEKEVSIWFLEERFLIADQNDDALLDKTELQAFPREFAYFLESRNYELTDKNQDGLLSFNELNTRRQTENIYLFSQQRKDLRELARAYPMLAQADQVYLKANPALVEALFHNLIWMYDNPELAAKVYQDKRWMAANPQAAIALQSNLRWLAANPFAANQLYRDRAATQKLPELLGWRASHKRLIRSMPEVISLWELDFIPQEIQVQRR
jgi:hypothetical protein